MAARDVPTEAVEAAALTLMAIDYGDLPLDAGTRQTYRRKAEAILAAAAPHIIAKRDAEVDAALRDEQSYAEWHDGTKYVSWMRADTDPELDLIADYLADTLGAGGEGSV